jgi:hypothetical protein
LGKKLELVIFHGGLNEEKGLNGGSGGVDEFLWCGD